MRTSLATGGGITTLQQHLIRATLHHPSQTQSPTLSQNPIRTWICIHQSTIHTRLSEAARWNMCGSTVTNVWLPSLAAVERKGTSMVMFGFK